MDTQKNDGYSNDEIRIDDDTIIEGASIAVDTAAAGATTTTPNILQTPPPPPPSHSAHLGASASLPPPPPIPSMSSIPLLSMHHLAPRSAAAAYRFAPPYSTSASFYHQSGVYPTYGQIQLPPPPPPPHQYMSQYMSAPGYGMTQPPMQQLENATLQLSLEEQQQHAGQLEKSQNFICPAYMPIEFTVNNNCLKNTSSVDEMIRFAQANIKLLQDVFSTNKLPLPHTFVGLPITFTNKEPMERFNSRFKNTYNLIPMHVDQNIHNVCETIMTNSKKVMLFEGIGGVGKSFAAYFFNCFIKARFSENIRVIYIHDAEVLLISDQAWLETFKREAIITFYDDKALCQEICNANSLLQVCQTIDQRNREKKVMYIIDNYNKIDLERLRDVTTLTEKGKIRKERAQDIEDFVKNVLSKYCSSVILVASSDCETRNDTYITAGLEKNRINFELHVLPEACIKSIGDKIFGKSLLPKEVKDLKELTNGIYLEILSYLNDFRNDDAPASVASALNAFKRACSKDYNFKIKHFIDNLKDDQHGTKEEKKAKFISNLIQMQNQKPVEPPLIMHSSWFLTIFEPYQEDEFDYLIRPRNQLALVNLTAYLRTNLKSYVTAKEESFLNAIECICEITSKHATYGDIFEKFGIERFKTCGSLDIKLNQFGHKSDKYPTMTKTLTISSKNHHFNEPFVALDFKLTEANVLFVPNNGYHPIFDLYALNNDTLWCVSYTLGNIMRQYNKDITPGDKKNNLIKCIIEFCLKHNVKHVYEVFFTAQMKIDDYSNSHNDDPVSFQALDKLDDYFTVLFSNQKLLKNLKKE